MSVGPIIAPMATTVAGLEPLIAAKSMQAMTALIASPPGSQPMSDLAKSTSLRLIAPSLMIAPLMMKSGIARSGGLSARERMRSMRTENCEMSSKPA